jgi:hypothetical protein
MAGWIDQSTQKAKLLSVPFEQKLTASEKEALRALTKIVFFGGLAVGGLATYFITKALSK